MHNEIKAITPQIIAEKNDQLRRMLPNLPFPHRCILSDEIATLSAIQLEWVIAQVRNFSDFNEGNNPYGENDFGSFNLADQKIFWKFDYFDPKMKYFEENGTRVLTIFFSSEY